jgi:predicted GNAT family acetyltransferase
MPYTDLPLVNNTDNHNFEMFVDGQRAFIDYQLRGDKLFLTHTEVPVELEGRGVASVLVEKVFQYAEEHDLKILPYCAYIKTWLKRHPDWERLIA